MARPTSERKDKKIDLRISQEMYEELAKEGQVSAVIRSRLSNVGQKNIAGSNSVAQNPFSSEEGKDLLEMLDYLRVTPEDFIKDIHGLMESGIMTYENGKMLLYDEYDLPIYLGVCKERKIDPKTMIDKITDSLRIKG